MLKISKEIFEHIIGADNKTDLYCIIENHNGVPVANDIRVMSGILRLEVKLEENKDSSNKLNNVWNYYLHIISVPILRHNGIKVFTSEKSRDYQLSLDVAMYKEKMESDKRMKDKITEILGGGYKCVVLL